jgi:Family of unknown function (DUF6600)
MKKINIVLAIVVMLALSIPSQQTKAQRGVSVSFQFFYDNLSSYGTWISYPQYGYVWQPGVGRGFHPYRTSGHWVWSNEYEWIWVSDYEWGWAPFHYGRWYYDSYYGWLWIPDYEWAPAWVVWRGGGDYYGWAPLGPGISISIAFGSYSPPYSYWCFVPRQYIASPTIYNYYVSPQQNTTIINNTTVINNYSTSGGPAKDVFVSGPQRTEVERYTQQSLTPVKLSESSSPGRTRASGDEVAIYKPNVSSSDRRSAKPSKVVTADKSNKINEPQRNQPATTQPQKEQPVRNEPQKNQPVRTEQQKKQPVTNEQQRNQPARTQPQQEQPVRNEPQKNQPQKSQPQKTEPPKNPPAQSQPPKSQPQKTEPAKNPPAKKQPPKKKDGNG